MTFVSAALFLYVGFGLGLVGTSPDNAVFNASVSVLTWGARIVGVLLLVSGTLTLTGARGGAPADFAASALAALLCLLVGIVWVSNGTTYGYILLLLGLLNSSAAWNARQRWRALRASNGQSSADPPQPQ